MLYQHNNKVWIFYKFTEQVRSVRGSKWVTEKVNKNVILEYQTS